MSWCASAGGDDCVFFIHALFETQEAVNFHVANMADIVANFGSMMAAQPASIITPIFVSAN